MHVCAKCIQDSGLIKVVEENLTEYECYYCSRESKMPIACDLHTIVEYMVCCIEEEYTNPDNGMRYISEEDRYAGTTYDTWDLLHNELGFEVDNETLFNDIVNLLPDHLWCFKHFSSFGELQKGIFSWEDFCKVIKSRRRYTFWTDYGKEEDVDGEEVLRTAEMLPRLSEIIRDNETTLDKQTIFWRAQVLDDDVKPDVPNRFTAPPENKTVMSSRMSPAGISMFYGAADEETAYWEVVDISRLQNKKVWAVQFESICALNFLDLTSVPFLSSYFSMKVDEGKNDLRFLNYFRDEISKSIERDEHQHIEYVPTQVFTEYVRYEMKTNCGEPFHGIIYPSSKTGKPCCVIFANQEDCLDGIKYREGPQLLRVVQGSLNILQLKIESPAKTRIISRAMKTDKEIEDEVLEKAKRLRRTGEAELPIREEIYEPAYSTSLSKLRGSFYGAKNTNDPTSFSTRKGIITQNEIRIAKKKKKKENIEPEDLVPK